MIPTLLISLTLYFSFLIAGMFGIGIAALGMLANLPICLAIDGYGPISDNAGGLAEMCKLDHEVRNITDELDAVGNTTAAIGKGFAIGSACLCAFALYGAFITKTAIASVNLMTPLIMSGILLGAMIPFLFSALTMKAVGSAAEAMISKMREIVSSHPKTEEKVSATAEEINSCIQIATDNSLKYMILPGLLVILTPILIGLVFGATCVAGVLAGIIISGIQMAISSSNSGGAWHNCKKVIKKKGIYYGRLEALYNDKNVLVQKVHKLENIEERTEKQEERLNRKREELRELQERLDAYEALIKENNGKIPSIKQAFLPVSNKLKGEELDKEENKRRLIKDLNTRIKINNDNPTVYYKQAEKASIIGDTVGDPLKDTSGPSLNILIKLSCITSVVFYKFYLNTGYAEKGLTV
jgi:Na+/H+-translocating membrane pyrophosphatase